jgi:hypothetical protein
MDHTYEGRVPTKKLATMVATPTAMGTETNDAWYIDSGATEHITPNLANLSLYNEYRGKDKVIVGNGVGLPISNIGSSTLRYKSHPFLFKQILHCPNVSTNLLSVNRFACNNHCAFILTGSDFWIKDIKSEKRLFHDKSENGVYPIHLGWHLFKSPVAFLCRSTMSSIWYQHLGHPSASTLS